MIKFNLGDIFNKTSHSSSSVAQIPLVRVGLFKCISTVNELPPLNRRPVNVIPYLTEKQT